MFYFADNDFQWLIPKGTDSAISTSNVKWQIFHLMILEAICDMFYTMHTLHIFHVLIKCYKRPLMHYLDAYYSKAIAYHWIQRRANPINWKFDFPHRMFQRGCGISKFWFWHLTAEMTRCSWWDMVSVDLLPQAMDKVGLQVGEYRGADFDQCRIADAKPCEFRSKVEHSCNKPLWYRWQSNIGGSLAWSANIPRSRVGVDSQVGVDPMGEVGCEVVRGQGWNEYDCYILHFTAQYAVQSF